MDRRFIARNARLTKRMVADRALRRRSIGWIVGTARYEYVYHFTWLGMPIIQLPADVVGLQEIIWATKPDLIIETGVARGGSIIFHASLLQLLGGRRRVVGIDVDIRPVNRRAIESHPLAHRVVLMQGSSTDPGIVKRVHAIARRSRRVMVILDSNHTHEHVARELELYSGLVRRGGYLVVCDTVVENMPKGYFSNRPWDRGDNPMTAVRQFLKANKRFEVDRRMDKLLLSANPSGYLRCIRDPAR